VLQAKFKPLPFIVLGAFFCTFLILSVYSSSLNLFLFSGTLAQSDVEVVRYKNLTIDLGDGISTKAQLSYPAIGKGPF
jgi:hypothetical protein